jgi:hypothetical protein
MHFQLSMGFNKDILYPHCFSITAVYESLKEMEEVLSKEFDSFHSFYWVRVILYVK